MSTYQSPTKEVTQLEIVSSALENNVPLCNSCIVVLLEIEDFFSVTRPRPWNGIKLVINQQRSDTAVCNLCEVKE